MERGIEINSTGLGLCAVIAVLNKLFTGLAGWEKVHGFKYWITRERISNPEQAWIVVEIEPWLWKYGSIRGRICCVPGSSAFFVGHVFPFESPKELHVEVEVRGLDDESQSLIVRRVSGRQEGVFKKHIEKTMN